MRGLVPAIGRYAAAYRTALGNASLRRLELAWGGAIAAEWIHFVALGVFAYEVDGALGVGVVGFVRLVPAAVLAPFAASLGDRFRRERFLLVIAAAGAMALGASAVAAGADAPAAAIYALAAILGVATTLFRPAQQALMPSLARTPDEVIAAHGAAAFAESLGTLAGPLVGGFVVAQTSTAAGFAVAAVTMLFSALLLARITAYGGVTVSAASSPPRRNVLEGVRTVRSSPEARVILALVVAQTVVRGSLNVLIVVVAFRLLEGGEDWVGFLTAALGAGGLVGAFGAVTLAGRPLALPFALSLVFWGAPIALLGGSTDGAIALTLIGVVGVANSVEDVSAFTLLQRIVPDAVLARVLGLVWGLAMAGVAIGSLAASALVSVLGERSALLATGALLPVLTLAAWTRLRRIDRIALPPPELPLLARVPMFDPLPVTVKEHLARRLVRVEVAPNEQIIRAGEAGDRFYVVERGEVEIEAVSGRHRAGPGAYFGEIALLRDVPRTATVTARTECALLALERDDFLAAVTGHPGGRTAGDEVVERRLAADATGASQ